MGTRNGRSAGALAVADEPAFDAARMDPAVSNAIDALTEITDLWKVIRPKVTTFFDRFDEHSSTPKSGETEHDRAGKMVGMLERLSRTASNLTKTIDEASRLRSFLTGGADSRPDLGDMSDPELIDVLVHAVLARGLWRAIEAKRKELGYVDTEAAVVG